MDEKVEIINSDAFVWLESNFNKYNVIFIDFPDPSNFSLGKLYSTTFYDKVKHHLSANGFIVVQSTSPFFAPKSFWCINSTLKDSFEKVLPYHVYLPSFGEWGFNMVTTSPKPFEVLRKVNGLKFYDYNWNSLTHFSKDMLSKDIIINRLNNQNLVTIFNKEWSSY